MLSILLLNAPNLADGVLNSIIYSSLGLVMALIAYKLIDIIIPGKISEQIGKENNVAMAIVVGSLILGICIIIAKVISA
ncbi:MAG: DUF350 domain-containing protein [Cytophagia bacterium]|nr:MAG: DUF350 domain-containing protein [Cytophagales bacterium]TAG46165.1 MAG: DUF350 domain-containing protein [Cytophagia bacterium]TAH29252.1 MAG: DUF350 domain-containing protein [Cytophagales bacterium]